MATATLRFEQLDPRPGWRIVDFISDLHLQAGEHETFAAFERYLRTTPADAVFILGDLFEVWVGDDSALAPGLARDCAQVLEAAASRRAVFFMHGNRDFLVGQDFLASCGVTLLTDPTVLQFAGARWLLTHGDALCLGDTDYMAFRAQVRTPQWQRDFLRQPLTRRQAVARALREQSEARKRSGQPYADVDEGAARAWLEAAHAVAMIHGHTHKPARHELGAALSRVVLSDWDAASTPPRLEVLRLSELGLRRVALAA